MIGSGQGSMTDYSAEEKHLFSASCRQIAVISFNCARGHRTSYIAAQLLQKMELIRVNENINDFARLLLCVERFMTLDDSIRACGFVSVMGCIFLEGTTK